MIVITTIRTIRRLLCASDHYGASRAWDMMLLTTAGYQ
jgi:hypothetical protein